jgi:hypothetical protein
MGAAMSLTPEQIAEWRRLAEESCLAFDDELGFVGLGGVSSDPVPQSWTDADWRFHQNACVMAIHICSEVERLRAENERLKELIPSLAHAEARVGLLERQLAAIADADYVLNVGSTWKAAKAREDRLKDALERVQWRWQNHITGLYGCPNCHNRIIAGHTPDCLVGMALEQGK